jgi:hypothetical protein
MISEKGSFGKLGDTSLSTYVYGEAHIPEIQSSKLDKSSTFSNKRGCAP